MAAMTGFRQRSIQVMVSCSASSLGMNDHLTAPNCSFMPNSGNSEAMPIKSIPAEKHFPLPERITTLISASRSRSSKIGMDSFHAGGFMALRFCGLLR